MPREQIFFTLLLRKCLAEKLLFERLEDVDVAGVQNSTINNLHKFAVKYADAIVQASPNIDKDVLENIKSSGKPFLQYPGSEDYIDAYQNFYQQFINQEEESEESEESEEELALIQN